MHRNLGGPAVSTDKWLWASQFNGPGRQEWIAAWRSEQRDQSVVPPSEGNEAKRDGQQVVGAC